MYFAEYVAGDITLGLIFIALALMAFFLAFRLPLIIVLGLMLPFALTLLLVTSAGGMVTFMGVLLLTLSALMARTFFAW